MIADGDQAGGLAGKVTSVTGGTAEVTLITDASSAVSAQVMPAGATGIVKPEVGDPRDLLLDFVEGGRRVTEDTTVVTSGFTLAEGESLFPRGIPIGRVTRVDLDEVEHLPARAHPARSPTCAVDIVQVLTSAARRRADRRGEVAVMPGPAPSSRVGLLLLAAVILQVSGSSQPASSAATPTWWRSPWPPWRSTRAACRARRRASRPASCSTSERRHDGRLVAGAHRRRLRRRALPRGARPRHGLMPIPVGAARHAGWVISFAAVSFMLDVGACVSPLVIRDMLVTILLNTLLAIPVFAVVRRLLRPALVVDPFERPPPAPGRRATPARSDSAGSRSDVPRRRQAPQLTPQLALRVAIIGGVALLAFAIVFFRLWYLQVLSGDKYRAEANDNQVREIKVQAPRGEIVDRDGRALVDNRTGLAVVRAPDKLPEDVTERREVYERLGRLLRHEPAGESSGRWSPS